MENLTVRLPEALVERIDKLAAAMNKDPNFNLRGTVTRSDAIREAIVRGVKVLERELDK